MAVLKDNKESTHGGPVMGTSFVEMQEVNSLHNAVVNQKHTQGFFPTLFQKSLCHPRCPDGDPWLTVVMAQKGQPRLGSGSITHRPKIKAEEEVIKSALQPDETEN